MQSSYSRQQFDAILTGVSPRRGWDFSRMADWRAPVPWDYPSVAAGYISSDVDVLDIGTGGGETFLALASGARSGLGTDLDPGMISTAVHNGRGVPMVSFRESSERLENVPEEFDVILDRHAPFSPDAVFSHLRPGGFFITQQVGERNMMNVKDALGYAASPAPIARDQIGDAGLLLAEFREYDVEYVVRDAESLVFWLGALDFLHADVNGADALASIDAFNAILDGNVSDAGFVTNEHRYLVVAQRPTISPAAVRA